MASSVILGCNILDHLAFIGFSGWLLCNLSADLIWVWDQVGAASTYSEAIKESSQSYFELNLSSFSSFSFCLIYFGITVLRYICVWVYICLTKSHFNYFTKSPSFQEIYLFSFFVRYDTVCFYIIAFPMKCFVISICFQPICIFKSMCVLCIYHIICFLFLSSSITLFFSLECLIHLYE